MIPMHEIAMVQDVIPRNMEENEDSEQEGSKPEESEDENEIDSGSKKNIFQLKTIEGGYNSGRKYIIRAKNGQDMRLMLQDISQLASTAREEAEAKSKIKKFQEKIANVFDSDTVQRILAIMIFAVILDYFF